MGAAQTFDVQPLDATFGAVVTGRKLAELTDAELAELYALWLEYALLVLPAQHLDRDQQIAFARRFGGDLEIELARISNVALDGTIHSDEGEDWIKTLRGNEGWHYDSTYLPIQAKGAVFSAHVVPAEGGETEFADMRAAYDALPPALRETVDTGFAQHSLHYSQARIGHKPGQDYAGYGFQVKEPPLRPLVKVHPETGRKAVLAGRHACGVVGMSPEESERFLDELNAFTCQAPRVYRQRWTPGDVVIWDNRCLMHKSCSWDLTQPRIMHHSRLAGDPASEFAAPG